MICNSQKLFFSLHDEPIKRIICVNTEPVPLNCFCKVILNLMTAPHLSCSRSQSLPGRVPSSFTISLWMSRNRGDQLLDFFQVWWKFRAVHLLVVGCFVSWCRKVFTWCAVTSASRLFHYEADHHLMLTFTFSLKLKHFHRFWKTFKAILSFTQSYSKSYHFPIEEHFS